MNLIFIDSEVANKNDGLAKICQFGYVIVDEFFNILLKNNIYINPGKNEDFSNIEDRKIDLDYKENNYEYYKRQPIFPNCYDEIIRLLTKEDTYIVGRSISNDLYYLTSEFIRYNLTKLNIKAFDVQLLYMAFKNNYQRPKLSDVVTEFFKDDEFIKSIKVHNSENDAYLTFKVFEKLFNQLKKIFLLDLFTLPIYRPLIVNRCDSFNIEFNKLKTNIEKEKFLKSIDCERVNRYVFFDIECANCFNGEGKICEFGRVIVNKDFSNLKSSLYLCNPGKGTDYKFALIGRKRKDLHLTYEENNYERYKKSPEFSTYIDNINYLFNQKDILIFGFDVLNDFNFLSYSYRRYKRPFINVFAIDVRTLYIKLLNEKMGLESIAKKYLSEEEFSKLKFHNSSIDAKATMLVLKSLLLKLNISLFDLINRVGVSCIISSKYDVMQERIMRKRNHLIDEIKDISKFIVKI